MQQSNYSIATTETIANEPGPLRGVTMDPETQEVILAVGNKVWRGTYREALDNESIAGRLRPETKAHMQLAVEEQGWDPIPSVSEASRINLTADQPEQYTAALERGERCLYKKFVCGFGVSLRKVGPVVPSAPTSRQEAEQICTAMLGQFPDAKVCQVSITEDGLAETQCPLPGDYFHIEYICESQPGKWGLNTDLSHHTYRDAVTRMATLREKGYLGVQLLRIRADE